LGGKRGRLISEYIKKQVVSNIQVALNAGCTIKECCNILEISTRTYIRWRNGLIADRRKNAEKTVVRKLTYDEQQRIINVSCEERFADLTPYCIIATLLDEGIYIASSRTFYRVLKSEGLIRHRQKSKPGVKRNKPSELAATGPNQVFSWDITYLKTNVRGIYYYAYVVLDVWSRKIVCWEIHDRESSEIAENMFKNMVKRLNLKEVKLHSDNGSPMKGGTILSTFYALGIITSFSRPRVSNDNPYSESLFKTVKYTAGYPSAFISNEHAIAWFSDFVNWYNTEHKHSGIDYITPEQRHSGIGGKILEERNKVMDLAYKLTPKRWGVKKHIWKAPSTVYLNRMVS